MISGMARRGCAGQIKAPELCRKDASPESRNSLTLQANIRRSPAVAEPQVFGGRGWLNGALVRALLEDPRFAGLEQLVGLEREGLLLRRRIPGGLLLFRAALPRPRTHRHRSGCSQLLTGAEI
jgi:hypothetical protein